MEREKEKEREREREREGVRERCLLESVFKFKYVKIDFSSG